MGVLDALTSKEGQCDERLWMNKDEMDWQMDMFSRNFDLKHWENAMKISTELGIDSSRVHGWELMNNAFAFPRVRRYDFVQNNMDMLEHFQDNLNMNRSNKENAERFSRVGKTVLQNFADKYHDGEFDAPAAHDPRQESLEKYNEGK